MYLDLTGLESAWISFCLEVGEGGRGEVEQVRSVLVLAVALE
jgi:hypothetical protein